MLLGFRGTALRVSGLGFRGLYLEVWELAGGGGELLIERVDEQLAQVAVVVRVVAKVSHTGKGTVRVPTT